MSVACLLSGFKVMMALDRRPTSLLTALLCFIQTVCYYLRGLQAQF